MKSVEGRTAWRARAAALIVALASTVGGSAHGPVPQVAAAVGGLIAVSSCGGGSECTSFQGKCTGFGTRQCITAPVALTPDAQVTEQCCGDWFQYPSIQVCPGREPAKACGVCLW